MRKVIIHYHLFKNAGTSVDHSLKSCFGDQWIALERDSEPLTSRYLTDFLLDHPDARVVSSHQALLPVPEHPEIRFFPILFLRHPIDRIRSVYDFERKQDAETFGAQLAKRTTLRGYIESRWENPDDHSVRNFQSRRLTQSIPAAPKTAVAEDSWARTVKAFSNLPFVGLVEEFVPSMSLYELILKPHFPMVTFEPIMLNTTKGRGSDLEQRLAKMKHTLSEEFFRRVERENHLDLALYSIARRRLETLVFAAEADAWPGSYSTANGSPASAMIATTSASCISDEG